MIYKIFVILKVHDPLVSYRSDDKVSKCIRGYLGDYQMMGTVGGIKGSFYKEVANVLPKMIKENTYIFTCRFYS